MAGAAQPRSNDRDPEGSNSARGLWNVAFAFIGLALTALAFTAVTAHFLGYPLATSYSLAVENGVAPDIWHERVAASEALAGDPFRSLAEMMPEHGFPAGVDRAAPRTPAAVLLQLPLLLIPDAVLMTVVTTLILVVLVAVLWLSGRISGIQTRSAWWMGPAVAVSFPVVFAVIYGSVSSLFMVALILVSWAFKDRRWAGIPLGVAMAMRLWPGLIVLGFWISGRKKAAIQALAVFVILNLAGTWLPGAGISGSISVLLGGAVDWVGSTYNAGVAHLLLPLGVPIAVSVVVAAGVALAAATRHRERAIPICLLGGLIASPLSWPVYSLAALPVMAQIWRTKSTTGQVLVGLAVVPALAWLYTPTLLRGPLTLAGLTLLLVYVVLSERDRLSRPEPGNFYMSDSAHIRNAP